MNLPPPMNTSRVQEALASLVCHLEFARDIAQAVKPVSLAKPFVEPGTIISTPHPKSVEITGTTCTVKGISLANVLTLKFEPIGSGFPLMTKKIVSGSAADKSFTAELPAEPVPGTAYRVWAIDDANRGDFVEVLIPEPEPKPASPSPWGRYSCAIGFLHTDRSEPGRKEIQAVLVSGCDGFPDDLELSFNSADISVNPRNGWIWYPGKKGVQILVTIKNPRQPSYTLTASSKLAGDSDSVEFNVEGTTARSTAAAV
jgi:hypothetical protein